MSSINIATVYPCILSIENGGFVNFVNFLGAGDKSLGKTTNFKSFELHRNFRNRVSPPIFTESRHLSNQ